MSVIVIEDFKNLPIEEQLEELNELVKKVPQLPLDCHQDCINEAWIKIDTSEEPALDEKEMIDHLKIKFSYERESKFNKSEKSEIILTTILPATPDSSPDAALNQMEADKEKEEAEKESERARDERDERIRLQLSPVLLEVCQRLKKDNTRIELTSEFSDETLHLLFRRASLRIEWQD